MEVVSAIPDDVSLRLQQMGTADLVVGIPSYNNETTIGNVVRTAAEGIARHFPNLKPLIVNSDGGSTDATQRVASEAAVASHVPIVSFVYRGIPGKGTALKAVFEAVQLLDAKACVVLDSDLRSVSPEWIELLAGPVVEGGFDYVAPLYVRHKNDGTITNNLAYPLTRALYGLAVRQPIGGDFGMSVRLASHFLRQDVWQTDVARFGIDIFMTTVAVNEDFRVCQSELGAKIHDVKDPAATLGPMFVQVVGTLFALMATYGERWQRVRGSVPPAVYGRKKEIEPEPVKVTVEAMVERFKAGARTFENLWGKVLDRQNFQKTVELARQTCSRLDFPAELWARVVYDFAVSFHKADRAGLERRDIVAGLTPLYYARTASVVVEASEMDSGQFGSLVEAQALVFEREKAYLVERWNA